MTLEGGGSMADYKQMIEEGRAVLGIELGSTRIKAVLIDEKHETICSGGHSWENRLENGVWTYSLDDIWEGLRDCYRDLASNVQKEFGTQLKKVAAIGFSAMMHGYMAFDKDGKLLAPFRTWRNNITGEAASKLIDLFEYNIPERWSIAHLYQSILNGEEHVKDIDYLTTLSGYIHYKMTGERVLGVDDVSGMFPIDPATKDYDMKMVEKFDRLMDGRFPWKLLDIMPRVLVAGEEAGKLTPEGAKLLDPTGTLEPGCPACPPAGDAGTGMVATNSVGVRTGNVSAGTSIFGMFVLEDNLKKVYPEIDIVTTPDGAPVAMVHANNCTSDINAWVNLFGEFAAEVGMELDTNKLFETLFKVALKGDPDCGKLLSYGYLSGEFIMDCMEGRPLFTRTPDSRMTLANFMRSHLYTALGALRVGMEILYKENVKIDTIFGHGGYFKTEGVGQKFLAAAMNAPVSVMETAGEGGPWGMAVLAAYMLRREKGEGLQDYLTHKVFAGSKSTTIAPDPADVKGFEAFMDAYVKGIAIEKAAVSAI